MQEQTNIRITRGHLAQLGSAVGGSSLLLAALGLIWQSGITPAIITFFGVGVTGLGIWAVMTPAEFKAFFTGRQARRSTVAIFSTLLLMGIVALVYIIVQREVIVVDFTIDSRFTLSEETHEVLRAATRSPRDIQILGFYYATEIIKREVDDQYFQLYEAASNGKVSRRYVDPIAEPGFSARFESALAQGIYLFIGYLNADGSIDANTLIPIANSGSQERDITEGISRLLAAGSFKVYFERSLETLDPIDNSQEGMSVLNNLLRSNGLITEPISLQELAMSNQRLPADASALIIMRPRRQMTPAEITIIDEYMERGGALLIGADFFFGEDIFMQEGSAFNDYMWENFGLRMLDMVVVDPGSSSQTQLDIVSAAVFGDNEIAANINIEGQPDTATRFRLARPIEVSEEPPVNNGRIIMTSPVSWGETNLEALANRDEFRYDDGADLRGPLTTVAWAHNQDTGAKIVLIGDGDFAMNGQVQSPIGNSYLFLDSVGWMTGFNEAVRFAPRGYLTSPVLFVGGQLLDVIAFITVVLMPGSMLVAAAAIWVRRQRL